MPRFILEMQLSDGVFRSVVHDEEERDGKKERKKKKARLNRILRPCGWEMSDANQLPTHPINNQSILEASYFRMEDLYQVLGLGKTASQSEIKTAYKKQVSDSGLLHPKSNTIRDKLMLIRSAPLFTSYSGSEMSSRSSIAREERTSDHSIQTDSKGL